MFFATVAFFTPEETERMLMAGLKHGLKPKIHANELDFSGGIQVGVKYGALSVDHLEFTGDEEIEALLKQRHHAYAAAGCSLLSWAWNTRRLEK
jgi:imidazolonepropionase-like amidohydrolase